MQAVSACAVAAHGPTTHAGPCVPLQSTHACRSGPSGHANGSKVLPDFTPPKEAQKSCPKAAPFRQRPSMHPCSAPGPSVSLQCTFTTLHTSGVLHCRGALPNHSSRGVSGPDDPEPPELEEQATTKQKSHPEPRIGGQATTTGANLGPRRRETPSSKSWRESRGRGRQRDLLQVPDIGPYDADSSTRTGPVTRSGYPTPRCGNGRRWRWARC